MPMKVTFTTFDGEIVSENRGGVLHDYVPDALGSTVALLDSTQTQTDTWSYWPNGESVRLTGSTPTKMLFVGTKGCHQDSATRTLMRYRVLETAKARFMTEDPIRLAFWMSSYNYADLKPATLTDPSGLFPCPLCYAIVFPPARLFCLVTCNSNWKKFRCPEVLNPPSNKKCMEECLDLAVKASGLACLAGLMRQSPLCFACVVTALTTCFVDPPGCLLVMAACEIPCGQALLGCVANAARTFLPAFIGCYKGCTGWTLHYD